MKIMAIPEGVMMWETKKNKSAEDVYLMVNEMGELLRWLDENRHGFIEDALKRKI
jgi:hypothetical protein